MSNISTMRTAVAVPLLTAAFAGGMSALPAVDGASPVARVAPARADAAVRQLWGVKLTWRETNAVANAPTSSAIKQIARGVGLGGPAVGAIGALWFSTREAARWSRFQGKCLGLTWIGSQVPGVGCP